MGEQKAQSQLRRLKGFIMAEKLPFEAAFLRPDDFRMEFCLQHAAKSFAGPMGSFELCIGYLLGYAEGASEPNHQKTHRD